LALAVHVDSAALNVNLIGLILMFVALIGFLLSPTALSIQRREVITQPTRSGPEVATVETKKEETYETLNRPRRTIARAAGVGTPRETRVDTTSGPRLMWSQTTRSQHSG
jgi:hypothetical protein